VSLVGVVKKDGRTDAYFDGAAQEKLMLRRCGACGKWYAPDTSSCADCGSEELGWAEASGDATLVSWAIVHSKDSPTAAVALIELAEGPWIHGRAETTRPRAGLPLRVRFIHPDNGESYPIFQERS
jgi:uncharacterized protein